MRLAEPFPTQTAIESPFRQGNTNYSSKAVTCHLLQANGIRLTNTQPDFSQVGNSELLDRTVRSNNWIRSDTIFIENEQIEALSNRPPWIAALLEQGLPGKPPDPAAGQEGISLAENMIVHVMDIGANYWSLWNFHQISSKNLAAYYQASPQWFDRINRRIGYNVRPSFI